MQENAKGRLYPTPGPGILQTQVENTESEPSNPSKFQISRENKRKKRKKKTSPQKTEPRRRTKSGGSSKAVPFGRS